MPSLFVEPLEELIQVQDEPALEIALPQVSVQPELAVLQRGQLANVESVITRLVLGALRRNGHGPLSLGPDYQALVNEFAPLFKWSMACWDYLLASEGCHFLLRSREEKWCVRGDYRAVTDTDYSRLVHRVFRDCVVAFAHQTAYLPATRTEGQAGPSFALFVRANFWDAIVSAYRKLENPPDARQRTLTPYSYLRCMPYQFLNAFHHALVHETLQKLSVLEHRAITLYFLHFFTLEATAQAMRCALEEVEAFLRRGLRTLLIDDRLVYCLLRQIERY